MARPGICYEDIINAIAILESQGHTPGINNVRDTIGRGSPTTISRFLKQWRDEQNSDEPPSKASDTAKQIQTVEIEVISTPSNSDPKTSRNETLASVKPGVKAADPMIQALIASSHALSSDILNSMSDEWSMILNESNPELKVRKLYAALVKEQTRRESAEQVAKEARIYADTLKEQTTQRISDLRDSLEGQIAFLNGQIRQLKRESEQSLEYYRNQLEKSNNALAKKRS
ncbi:DNA-binding protein [Caedibacter taeniospiralis]|uniref:DNA-binding protein n=1 Tax=Caedibacter taeniospiralis TaxID=28907 RepID=UPI000C276B56|nr:DNA-binding protein [Caedibacter taeniospiralis]